MLTQFCVFSLQKTLNYYLIFLVTVLKMNVNFEDQLEDFKDRFLDSLWGFAACIMEISMKKSQCCLRILEFTLRSMFGNQNECNNVLQIAADLLPQNNVSFTRMIKIEGDILYRTKIKPGVR